MGQQAAQYLNVTPAAPALTFKIHGKPAIPVLSFRDAADKWNRYVMECMKAGGGGCSQVGNGGVIRDGGKIVAKV